MKVSIITATYNSAKTISDTLRSLEEQTYQNIEYIIVDGVSEDDTLKVIQSECSRVSAVITEKDEGLYDALNKGIEASTGEIVGFLHSDDLFAYPGAVQDIVETFQKNDSQAMYADLEYVAKHDTDKRIRLWTSGEYSRNKLKMGWMPPHPTFYMKRKLYEQYGTFDLSFDISADYDSLLRYLWVNNVSMAYLPKVLIKMRVGGVSNRSMSSIIQKTKEDVRALKKSSLSWPKALLIKNLSKLPQFTKK
ncbi:glycosyl transferase [Vibrio breoganii]|uniref:glycosyltransferase family 2 protein n=1 Tax=Vibrio breoganii TaxID=553239 RepID=UPI000C83EAE4|nr:glycosyltransferase family 2 protein [Vibrio breoganii]PML15745.1 glycosyl transferase [Vibrio breoganii]PMO59989.1 glycosyl transferase [Vibrio breoganii]